MLKISCYAFCLLVLCIWHEIFLVVHSLSGVWNCKLVTMFMRTVLCMLWTMNYNTDFNEKFLNIQQHQKKTPTHHLLEKSMHTIFIHLCYWNWRKNFMENSSKRLSDVALLNYELTPNKQESSFITFLCSHGVICVSVMLS